MKRLTALAGATAILLTLTACSSGTSGFPTPTTTAGATTSDNGGSSSTSSSGSSGGKIGSVDQLANTQACSLLTADEASSAGLPNSPSDDLSSGAKSGCTWNGSSFIVAVLIRTDVGTSGLVAAGTVTSTSVGSHSDAKKMVEGSGAGAVCLYAIGINSSTRVDVQATAISSSAGDPCQEALAVAQTVEKKLP